MNEDDPTITSLRKKTKIACEEFRGAMATHEVWRQAAYDEDLHKRMGRSYATNAFVVIRGALRRETLMSLMRLWDNDPKALSLTNIKSIISNGRVVNCLADICAQQWEQIHIYGLEDTDPQHRQIVEDAARSAEREFGRKQAEQFRKYVEKIISLISKYQPEGAEHETFLFLKNLRDQHLAHKQISPKSIVFSDQKKSDDAIENFYQDMSKIIHLLRLVAENVHYDPAESAEMFRRNANLFWESVKGEMTDGHPSYVERRRRQR